MANVIGALKPSPPPTIPAVTTTPLTNITASSAVTGGTIVTNGNAAITQSGIVWSKVNTTPMLTNNVIAGTTSSGSFTTNLTGLDFNTEYYIRAYAINSVGTGYGDVESLNMANDTSKVRFPYKGKEMVYGIIISFTSSKNGSTEIQALNVLRLLLIIIRFIVNSSSRGARRKQSVNELDLMQLQAQGIMESLK